MQTSRYVAIKNTLEVIERNVTLSLLYSPAVATTVMVEFVLH